jgi:c-di-GMP-binding flagellar brake protein YcgR
MEQNAYGGPERRKFIRIDYEEPLNYKVCKLETVSKLLSGYTQNVSQTGLLCKLKDHVPEDAVLWLCFNMDTLELCQQIETHSIVIQKGVLTKVVRINPRLDGCFDVGVCFITREEKDQGFVALCNKLNKEKVRT